VRRATTKSGEPKAATYYGRIRKVGDEKKCVVSGGCFGTEEWSMLRVGASYFRFDG
jgi:hypothetical protein